MGASLQAPSGGPSGARRRKGRRHKPMAEINVTPFVDVMLVLLIIFMVAAPLLTVGVPVDLPKSEGSELKSESEPLTVTVDPAGQDIHTIGRNSADRSSDKIIGYHRGS